MQEMLLKVWDKIQESNEPEKNKVIVSDKSKK